jgi:hypothetical protein
VYRIAIAIIAVAVAGMLAAEHVAAQAPRGGGGAPSVSHVPPPKGSQGERVTDVPSSLGGQVQASLGKLEEELRITAGQQKAWDAYATRVMRFADDVARARFAVRELEGTAVTAPQLFDRVTQTAQDRLTAIEDIVEAGRALYAKLSTEQQKVADRRLAVLAMMLATGVPPTGGARP